MFFLVGIETPKDANTAYGMVVPVFSAFDYGCFSAADTQADIPAMVREAVLLTLEDLISSGTWSVEQLNNDSGNLVYSTDHEYSGFDSWFVIDIDLSAFKGNQ